MLRGGWGARVLLLAGYIRSNTCIRTLQAAAVLDAADIVQHAPVLTDRFTAAQAAVTAIPEQPVTSSFLAVGPAPGLEALRSTVAGLMGALSVARVVEVCFALACAWCVPPPSSWAS